MTDSSLPEPADVKVERMDGSKLGSPAQPVEGSFVMTDRSAHEAWASLIMKNKMSAMVLHHLTSKMGSLNAVVVSQKTLGQMMGVSAKTIQRAIAVLVADRWITVINLNGAGTMPAYVVNDQVAWGESRDKMHLSVFSAAVIANRADQTPETLARTQLRRIPVLYGGERQIPTGAGDTPPSQPLLPGTEPWLPGLSVPKDDEMDAAVARIEQGP